MASHSFPVVVGTGVGVYFDTGVGHHEGFAPEFIAGEHFVGVLDDVVRGGCGDGRAHGHGVVGYCV